MGADRGSSGWPRAHATRHERELGLARTINHWQQTSGLTCSPSWIACGWTIASLGPWPSARPSKRPTRSAARAVTHGRGKDGHPVAWRTQSTTSCEARPSVSTTIPGKGSVATRASSASPATTVGSISSSLYPSSRPRRSTRRRRSSVPTRSRTMVHSASGIWLVVRLMTCAESSPPETTRHRAPCARKTCQQADMAAALTLKLSGSSGGAGCDMPTSSRSSRAVGVPPR